MHRLTKLSQALNDMGHINESADVDDLSSIDWEAELGQSKQDLSDEDYYDHNYFNIDYDEVSNISEKAQNLKGQKYIDNYDLIGFGAFRRVFRIPGNDDYVLKVAMNNDGIRMNKAEFKLQLAFRDLFPKVYKHGKNNPAGTDYDWMIVEKVMPMANNDIVNDQFPYMKKILKVFSKNPRDSDVQNFFYYYSLMKGIGLTSEPYLKTMNKLVKLFLNNEPLFLKLIEISAETGMSFSDIKPSNLGINNEGQFVIIDASIFNKHLPSIHDEIIEELDDEVRFDADF
jgi:hypothetical protein